MLIPYHIGFLALNLPFLDIPLEIPVLGHTAPSFKNFGFETALVPALPVEFQMTLLRVRMHV